MPASTRTVRPSTPEERALIAQWAERRRTAASPSGTSGLQEFGIPAAVSIFLVATLWGFRFGWGPISMAGQTVAFVAAFLTLRQRWRARQAPVSDLPDEEVAEVAEVVEVVLEPTRAVFSIDENGDGSLWCVLDHGDGTWTVLADEELPYVDDLVGVMSHQRVIWTTTTDGIGLTLRGEGAPIPNHGAIHGREEAEIEAAIARGYCWSPQHEGPTTDAVLPRWMVDWSVDPEPVDLD